MDWEAYFLLRLPRPCLFLDSAAAEDDVLEEEDGCSFLVDDSFFLSALFLGSDNCEEESLFLLGVVAVVVVVVLLECLLLGGSDESLFFGTANELLECLLGVNNDSRRLDDADGVFVDERLVALSLCCCCCGSSASKTGVLVSLLLPDRRVFMDFLLHDNFGVAGGSLCLAAFVGGGGSGLASLTLWRTLSSLCAVRNRILAPPSDMDILLLLVVLDFFFL